MHRADRPRGPRQATAVSISHLPPVSTLFAAFLGYNPAGHLIGPHVLSQLTPAQRATVTGERFFPSLITDSFRDGLHTAFDFAIVMCLAGAAASWTRGGKAPARTVEDEAPVDEPGPRARQLTDGGRPCQISPRPPPRQVC